MKRTNNKSKVKMLKAGDNAVPAVSALTPIDFNQERTATYRYGITSDNKITITRNCLLNLKLSKPLNALDSTPTELMPHYSAVKLLRVKVWNPNSGTSAPGAEPPSFIWASENSNGKAHRIQAGSVLMTKREFVPTDRPAMWSNDTASNLTNGESLFVLEHANNCLIDVTFRYVETCGSSSVCTCTSTGFTSSSGTVFPPLDNMANGTQTLGTWFCDPVLNVTTCHVTTGNKPSVFTRS
jgi:hypothetical protein